MLGFLKSFGSLNSIMGKRSYLGVDIGTTSIKIVELAESGGHPTLRNYGVLESYGHLERLNNAIQTSTLKMLDKESLLESQRKRIQTQNQFLANLAGRTLLKRLDNLSDGEWQRKSFLNIQKGDFLLVVDPNLVSENVTEKIRGSVVIYKKKLSVRKDFIYVSADKLKLDEIEHFASVSSEQLQKALAGHNVLKNVVEAYKKERQTTL